MLRSPWMRRLLPQARSLFQVLLEAAAIGVLSGLACVAVRLLFRVLQWCITGHSGPLPLAAQHLAPWRRALTPAFGALLAIAVASVAARLLPGSGTTEYVEAVRLENGRIAWSPTLWRTLSSAFSVATGAAIGREGSMIQFAAAAVSFAGQRFRFLRLPLPSQVACGVAAAVAAAYQAPLAGVCFAAEIVIGRFEWRLVPALLVSALAGAFASRQLLVAGPLFAARPETLIPGFSTGAVLLLALLMGLLGPACLWLLRSLRGARKLPLPLLWSGAVVGLLSLSATTVWGNGDVALTSILQSAPVARLVLSILALRLIATFFCVGTGTVGGVFTPTLFAGSAIGLLLGHVLHAPDALLFALIGMGSLLAAVTHAPFMATLMTVELTGEWSLLPLTLLCNLIAWQIAARLSPHSLYAIASDLPGSLRRQEQSGTPDLPSADDRSFPMPEAGD